MFPSHVFAPIPFYEKVKTSTEIIMCPLSASHLTSHTRSTMNITQGEHVPHGRGKAPRLCLHGDFLATPRVPTWLLFSPWRIGISLHSTALAGNSFSLWEMRWPL